MGSAKQEVKKNPLLMTCIICVVMASGAAYAHSYTNSELGTTRDDTNIWIKIYNHSKSTAIWAKKQVKLLAKMYNKTANMTIRLQLETNEKQLTFKKKAKLHEELYNLRLQEQTAPFAGVCDVIARAETPDQEASRKNYMSAQADTWVANSSTFTHQIAGSASSTSSRSINELETQNAKQVARATALKEDHPYLFKSYDTDAKRQEAYANNTATPKPYEGDMLMNPHFFTNYDDDQLAAVKLMVNEYLVPPYAPTDTPVATDDPESAANHLRIQQRYQLAHDAFTDVYTTRMPIDNGISQLARDEALDDYYYNGVDSDPSTSILFKVGNSDDDYGPTTMKRLNVLMDAHEIHQQIQEYKRDLITEAILTTQLSLALEKKNE